MNRWSKNATYAKSFELVQREQFISDKIENFFLIVHVSVFAMERER